MAFKRVFLSFLLIGVPMAGFAGVTAGDFPGSAFWYLHADLEQMRSSDSGRGLYHWLDKELLDNRGKIPGGDSHGAALFVLTADKTFVQARLKTDRFAHDDDEWDSNIIRNTEQAAFMVSDKDGMISIDAHPVSKERRRLRRFDLESVIVEGQEISCADSLRCARYLAPWGQTTHVNGS